jgi:hypothetical protein
MKKVAVMEVDASMSTIQRIPITPINEMPGSRLIASGLSLSIDIYIAIYV